MTLLHFAEGMHTVRFPLGDVSACWIGKCCSQRLSGTSDYFLTGAGNVCVLCLGSGGLSLRSKYET